MILFKIFLEFLKIGAFSFGGGMSTLPYIFEMASRTSWISVDYINNILTLSQITPGPLACNMGTIVGNNVAGITGAVIANIAFVIPAILFVGFTFKFIKKIEKNKKAVEVIKIVRSAALAILITSSITIFKNAYLNNYENFNLKNIIFFFNYKSIILGILIFYITKNKKINTILFMIFSAIIGGFFRI